MRLGSNLNQNDSFCRLSANVASVKPIPAIPRKRRLMGNTGVPLLVTSFWALDIRLKPSDNDRMAHVVLEQLTKTFQRANGTSICAVDGVSLAVEDKELLVIVGPSGCGKTTLLRLISGLEEPTGGTIAMDGTTLNRIAAKHRDVAMVFQNPALYPHMSAYENMAFGLKLRKHSRAEIDSRVNEAAGWLGLMDCLARKPMELSGGERQRVALGRAMVRRPKLFLFDEPLSNLDPQLRGHMQREISKLHERLQATIIYVTHDQSEAMRLGQRVAVLSNGRIHQLGQPLEIYAQPVDRFVAGFIGTPSMNFFGGTIVRQEEIVCFETRGTLTTNGEKATVVRVEEIRNGVLKDYFGKEVIMGIRPEHIAEQSGNSDSRANAIVNAVVRRVEHLGPESYLHLTTPDGHEFIAQVAGNFVTTTGKTHRMEFKLGHAHFFDPESGNRIG
jgi:multiple sugar transport system ATP-binding protein